MEPITIVLLLLLVAFFVYQKYQSSQPFEEYPGNKVNEVKDLSQFNVLLKTSEGGKIVVVDFFATWCPPCRASAPKYGKMSTEFDQESVTFLKVNVDTGKAIAKQEKVSRMPTFKIYKDGKCEKEFVGYKEKEIRQAINQLIKK